MNTDFHEMLSAFIAEGVEFLLIPVLGRGDLIRNKRAAGRPKDQADLALLEELAQGD